MIKIVTILGSTSITSYFSGKNAVIVRILRFLAMTANLIFSTKNQEMLYKMVIKYVKMQRKLLHDKLSPTSCIIQIFSSI